MGLLLRFLFSLFICDFTILAAYDTANVCIYEANNQSNNIGCLQFKQNGSSVTISGVLRGLSSGEHGFHVHEKGSMGNACGDAGAHFNPTNQTHGAPTDTVRHVGDLGNIISDGATANIAITDSIIALNGANSVIGRAVVVHSARDDLGRGGNETSLTTGNAGARIACGIITGDASSNTVNTVAVLFPALFVFVALH